MTMATMLRAVRRAWLPQLATLTWIETRRYLRSPILLAALVLTGYSLFDTMTGTVTDVNSVPVWPAFFLGGLGLLASFRLTQSTRPASPALTVTPVSPQLRTAALCLTAIAPLLAGGLSVVAILTVERIGGQWEHGTFSSTDQVVILASQVIACSVGGPLLGVALGRWLRYEWIGPVVFVALVGWMQLVVVIAAAHRNSLAGVLLRMFSPFTFFSWGNDAGAVETWRGSPTFFLGWQLGLCALCVTIALRRGADLERRRQLNDAILFAAVFTVAMYVLAVTGGVSHVWISLPGESAQSTP
jgi:hypothetical protein